MANKKDVQNEVQNVKEILLQLRDDCFYGKVHNKGNELLDRFNKVIWEIEVPLTNLINEM